mgnify:CR=1 FL=1
MKVRIIKDRFGGMGWRAEPGVLHLGGVGTAGVESLSFALPEEWSGMAVTLHIEQEGGTLPQPVLLDESRTVTVDHRFTTARQGLWMLLAQSADGYTAMSCPAKYDCYDTIGLSGTVEDVDPSVYAQFVALVQQAVNTAMNEGAAAKDAAKTAQAAMDAAQKGAAATQKERMSAEDAESAAALAAARTQADITAAAASAASALGAAAETLDACTAATQAANRAANLAPKKEERRLLMRLLQEAAYQTKTADTLLDQLSGVWAEVPVGAVTLTRDSLTLYAGERAALGVRISPENATEQTVLWESSDEAVAAVEDGVITAKTPGGARITARADGCSAECAVLVKPTVERVNTFSQTISPSMRLGFLVLPTRLLECYRQELGFYTCTVPALEQHVLARFIAGGHYERHLSRMRKEYRDRRSATISAFRASPLASHVTFSEEGAGLHFLLRLDTNRPDEELRRLTAEAGIRLSFLSEYAAVPDPRFAHTLVVNYAGLSQSDLAEALRLLTDVLLPLLA